MNVINDSKMGKTSQESETFLYSAFTLVGEGEGERAVRYKEVAVIWVILVRNPNCHLPPMATCIGEG